MNKLSLASLSITVILFSYHAYATPVSLHVQAPIDYNNPQATDLRYIESYMDDPVFKRDYKIPYDSLQTNINLELKEIIAPGIFNGKAVCPTVFCPDVYWSASISPTFKFLKKDQPTVTSIGISGESKVRIDLTSEMRLDVHAKARAYTDTALGLTDDDTGDVPIDAFVVINVKGSAEVELWPEIKAYKPGTNEPGIAIELTMVDKNIDLNLNGQGVAIGAKWGSLVGLSPVGFLVGGPILGPFLGAILGDEAAEMAEKELSRVFYSNLNQIFAEQSKQIDTMMNNALKTYIAQANQIRSQVTDSKLPGINKSLNELSSDMGMKIDVHTIAPNGGIAVAAITRFLANPSNGQIQGKIRLPKQECQYATIDIVGTQNVIPLGLMDTNLDLKSKVGGACSSVISNSFTHKAYLGGDPQRYLGNSAQSLPEWKSVGSLALTGTMSETEKWYECSFTINNLPKVSIIEFSNDNNWLKDHHVNLKERYLHANLDRTHLLFNSSLKPIPEIVLGGEGKCEARSSKGGAIEVNPLGDLKDTLNPEKCPQCGITDNLKVDRVINVTNPQAFGRTPAGKTLIREAVRKQQLRTQETPSLRGRSLGVQMR